MQAQFRATISGCRFLLRSENGKHAGPHQGLHAICRACTSLTSCTASALAPRGALAFLPLAPAASTSLIASFALAAFFTALLRLGAATGAAASAPTSLAGLEAAAALPFAFRLPFSAMPGVGMAGMLPAAACSCFTAAGGAASSSATPGTPCAATAALRAAAKDAPLAGALLLLSGSVLSVVATGAFFPRLLGCSASPFNAAAAEPSVLTTTLGAEPLTCPFSASCFRPMSCSGATAVPTCAAVDAFLALPAFVLGPLIFAWTIRLLIATASLAARLGMLLVGLVVKGLWCGCRLCVNAVSGLACARGGLGRLRAIRQCLRRMLMSGSWMCSAF